MHVPIRSNEPEQKSRAQQGHEQNHLGYLYVDYRDDGSYVGGLLIVTLTGCPVAFHYTRPICPDELHRILYGASLEQAIAGDLIGKSLIDATRQKLKCLFLSHPACLTVRPHIDFAAVCRAVEGSGAVGARRVATVTAGGVEWYVREGFEADGRVVAELIEQVGGTDVLLEPFVRVRTALEHLRRQAA